MTPADRDAFRSGVRIGIPFAAAGLVLSLSFGVLAREAGFGIVAPMLMSLLVWAGSAQFSALAVLTAGGTPLAAIAAATLMNSRFLPMGAALAPSLPGGPVKRFFQGQTVVDASWAVAARPDGTFDRWVLFGTSLPQFFAWQIGTLIGLLAGDAIGDLDRWGLDAVYPAFFAAILIPELRSRSKIGVAVAGGLIALALVPVAPPGVPVLAAALAALWGLRRTDA